MHLIFQRKNVEEKYSFRPLQKISWKNCIKATEKKFKYALGHIYVNEKGLEGTEEIIEDVLNINAKIQKSLEAQISNNTWMDDETKRRAIVKSKLIRASGTMKSLITMPGRLLQLSY